MINWILLRLFLLNKFIIFICKSLKLGEKYGFGKQIERQSSNNVGGPGSGMVTEIDEEDWHRSIDLNIKSAVMGSKYAIPAMEKSGGGSIINVSSIDGTQAGSTRNVPYSISKAAISHLSRIMAVHHGRQNIRVNCVAPGHVYGAFPNRFKKMEEDWRDLRKKAGPLGTEGTAWDVPERRSFDKKS